MQPGFEQRETDRKPPFAENMPLFILFSCKHVAIRRPGLVFGAYKLYKGPFRRHKLLEIAC